MRQLRWLEFVKDCNCTINYHPGKANRVADALSRKSLATLMVIHTLPLPLHEEITKFGIEIIAGELSRLTLQPTIFDGLKKA